MDPRMDLLPKPRPESPVFCSQCRWFEWESYDFGGIETCHAPINCKHNYKYQNIERILKPEERNKHNRCSAFEQKLTVWMFLTALYYTIKAHVLKN